MRWFDGYYFSMYLYYFIYPIGICLLNGVLTPIIGKKYYFSFSYWIYSWNCWWRFFITSVYQELPNAVGTIYETFTSDTAIIDIEVSPYVNINELMKKLDKTDGVISIVNKELLLKEMHFPERKKIIEEKIPIVDKNLKIFL